MGFHDLAENGSPLGHIVTPNRSQISLVSIDRRLDPPKMTSGRWFGKKHEKLMKNLCENRSFLMAQNHVWRYTLRLFHTFSIFGKRRKIDAKREAQSHISL